MTTRQPSDSQLWSWVDRDAPELTAYLREHPEAQPQVDALRETIAGIGATDESEPMPARIGEYRIQGLLGRGGMGVVYAAEQDCPQREVALKVLPRAFAEDADWLNRFAREADALARLAHPGVCTVFAVGQGPDTPPHIAMQRIHGVPLDRWLASGPSHRRRLLLAQRLCAAVGHAHDHEVVHRDLKPANVLVTEDDQPVVVDFGLADLLDHRDHEAAQRDRLCGTLPYMSPEQTRSAATVDIRSDVYGLGVLLFEMFCGQRPYDLTDLGLADATQRIQNQPPQLSGRAGFALRGDLRHVVLHALEKRPGDRYPGAGEMAADLQRCLDGRLIEARQASRLRRILRWGRRRWLLASSAAAVVLMGLLLLFPAWLPAQLGADWWWQGSPFDGLRWQGQQPIVKIEERWYALEAIEGLRTEFIIGFCHQTSRPTSFWRKRFSEDLVQVLNRLGVVCLFGLDLELRDLETGQIRRVAAQPCSSHLRREIWKDRVATPWDPDPEDNSGDLVTIDRRRYQLLGIDGVSIDTLRSSGDPSLPLLIYWYDAYCAQVGRSPGSLVDLRLRDPETQEVIEMKGMPRNRPPARIPDK